METEQRSLARAISWRVVAWTLTVGIVYLFTGRAVLALAIGMADSLLKIFAFYLHERGWMSLGRSAAATATATTTDDARALAG